MSGGALFVAVFLACLVEAVEALTIVLAAGSTREWRSTLVGVGTGLVALGLVVAILGPRLHPAIPIGPLRLLIGGLLLAFGLQWLRKAILRAAGLQSLHDEGRIYAREVDVARTAAVRRRGFVNDWYAFTLSFKGVLLEGLEVVFIVLTLGGSQHRVGLAALAAVAAVVVVTVTGLLVRAPLARVPENSLKFVVGAMLTGFGIFWSVEGAGASGPARMPHCWSWCRRSSVTRCCWSWSSVGCGRPDHRWVPSRLEGRRGDRLGTRTSRRPVRARVRRRFRRRR